MRTAEKHRPLQNHKDQDHKKKVRRRDRPGHIDPQYGKQLQSFSEGHSDESNRAFIRGPRSSDPLAEDRGEDFVEAITSGEDPTPNLLNARVPEEDGGPFIETDADTEFAEGTDESNPDTALREPFPRT